MKVWGEDPSKREDLKKRAARERVERKSQEPFKGFGKHFGLRYGDLDNVVTNSMGHFNTEADTEIGRLNAKVYADDAACAAERLACTGMENDAARMLTFASIARKKECGWEPGSRSDVASHLNYERKSKSLRSVFTELHDAWQRTDNEDWVELSRFSILPLLFKEGDAAITIISDAIENLPAEKRDEVVFQKEYPPAVKKRFVVDLVEQGKLTEKAHSRDKNPDGAQR